MQSADGRLAGDSYQQRAATGSKGLTFLLAVVCSALRRTRQGFAPPHREHAPLTEPAQRTEQIYASKKEKLVDINPASHGRPRFTRFAVKSLDTGLPASAYFPSFRECHCFLHYPNVMMRTDACDDTLLRLTPHG